MAIQLRLMPPPLQRIEDLTEPPVVGRFYLVPCIARRHPRYPDAAPAAPRTVDWIAVTGSVHTDPEILASLGPHRHFDFRFVSNAQIARYFTNRPLLRIGEAALNASHDIHHVKHRRRLCRREQPEFPALVKEDGVVTWRNRWLPGLEAAQIAAGRRLDPANPYCPHRGIRLHDQPIDADGCTVCPGHGLKWHRTTGELVSRFACGDCE